MTADEAHQGSEHVMAIDGKTVRGAFSGEDGAGSGPGPEIRVCHRVFAEVLGTAPY